MLELLWDFPACDLALDLVTGNDVVTVQCKVLLSVVNAVVHFIVYCTCFVKRRTTCVIALVIAEYASDLFARSVLLC